MEVAVKTVDFYVAWLQFVCSRYPRYFYSSGCYMNGTGRKHCGLLFVFFELDSVTVYNKVEWPRACVQEPACEFNSLRP